MRAALQSRSVYPIGLPALTSAHTYAMLPGAIVHARMARNARESDEKKVILFNFSGHGHFDLSAYDAYLSGKMDLQS